MKTFYAHLVLLSLLLLQPVGAQSPQTARPPDTTTQQKQPVEDPLGRSTPHGTVVGLMTAVERENLDRAAEYLESGVKLPARQALARQLSVVLDRRLFTSLSRLSNEPDGNLDDGLTNRDRIGLVESPSGNVEMFLDRVPGGQGNIWLFSSTTLEEIPRLYEEIQPPWFERYLSEWLRTRWLSLQLYRWIAILLLIPLLWGLSALATRALTGLLRPVLRRFTQEQAERKVASQGPLRLLILALFFYGTSFFGLSLAARYFWYRVAATLMVMALCWLSLRLVNVVAELSLQRLQRVHGSGDTALVHLISRLLKASSVVVAVLVLLYLFEVDLTAAVTGLGIGGLAIGFGAQKTIENLFGGIMVISDKPINVGDMCKVGQVFGMVEDIGIRSTRIRTLDRTVVSVPNGQLASVILENFTERDRILFHHTVGLAPQTTADQLREVLDRIRRMLDAHPEVAPGARTRFIKISGASFDLEIFAYVLEIDYPAFLSIQEELLLRVMDIITASGTAVALPPFTMSAKAPALDP